MLLLKHRGSKPLSIKVSTRLDALAETFIYQRINTHGTIVKNDLIKNTNRTKKLGDVFYSKSQCTTDKYQLQKVKEPWLIIYNLLVILKMTAKKVVEIYRLLTQIEEDFRDTKNIKFGISLEQAKTDKSWIVLSYIYMGI